MFLTIIFHIIRWLRNYVYLCRMKKILKAFLGLVIILLSAKTDVLADDSVLASGVWYKMSISSTGMYKLTYSDLASMGVDVANIDPRKIKIYHNGGGVLPKINRYYYPDDLYEIPIFVSGEDDGVFNQNDYILFYARGPVVWKYNEIRQYYRHEKNPYTSYTYAFLTIGEDAGRRIQTEPAPSGEGVTHVTDFLDYKVIDVDEVNINNMGCTWFFDRFDITLHRSYDFSFDNLNTNKPAKMKVSMASKNTSSASMALRNNNRLLYSKSFQNSGTYYYARWDTACLVSFEPVGSPIVIDANYSRSLSSSVAWMDYIAINAWRYLKMSGNVMAFRNPDCSNASVVYEYDLQNAGNFIKIWNVTDPINPTVMSTTLSGNTMSFKVRGDVKNQFIAFNGSNVSSPTFVGTIANQNLHAMRDVDYLIITHPSFQSQAERLKELHSRLDDYVIEIVQPQYIYNEFSCGALDVAGIRNFVRMLYKESSEEHKLKYVLLFGDASYDYKNTSECLIPTWESFESCCISGSVVTDDFYVCMGDDEGNMEAQGSQYGSSIIDLAVARMPVRTTSEANDVIAKIEAYVAKNSITMNKWRNVITLMCDDEESQFISNMESIANNIPKWGGDVIIDKIYLDAYNQIATASGQRCPEMNEAIANRMEKGTLVWAYYGHGGEIGLTEERILTIPDIQSWKNIPMMPLFITATCEFSRYDDHTRTSAGEIMFTKADGGAIAMITTARTTGGSGPLLQRTFTRMFQMTNGEYPTMGDIFIRSKADSSPNTKVFTLFGDPALRLAYPKYNVVLTQMNGKPVTPPNDTILTNDTLKALSNIELRGEVRDNFGEKMTGFNGIVSVSVYDKENHYRTKGDNGAVQVDFNMRNSLLFDGKAAVEEGEFTISFTVPKDINYSYGKGMVSFYATDYQVDANGTYTNLIVGGYNNEALPDVDGPKARIFIDDTLFVSGGITNENPMFLAYVSDEHGINTTGAGIGHDITATLSGATTKIYNLNSSYEIVSGSNDWGSIAYRFYNLNEGDHHLTFKVWDIYNNSTTVSLDFTVVKSNNMVIENIFNAPNPMTSYTNFQFEHNQKGEVEVEINIYNLSGQKVKTIKDNRFGTSTRVDPIYWDGTSDSGAPLKSGVYIYNVTMTNNNGEKTSGFSKLIIAR